MYGIIINRIQQNSLSLFVVAGGGGGGGGGGVLDRSGATLIIGTTLFFR